MPPQRPVPTDGSGSDAYTPDLSTVTEEDSIWAASSGYIPGLTRSDPYLFEQKGKKTGYRLSYITPDVASSLQKLQTPTILTDEREVRSEPDMSKVRKASIEPPILEVDEDQESSLHTISERTSLSVAGGVGQSPYHPHHNTPVDEEDLQDANFTNLQPHNILKEFETSQSFHSNNQTISNVSGTFTNTDITTPSTRAHSFHSSASASFTAPQLRSRERPRPLVRRAHMRVAPLSLDTSRAMSQNTSGDASSLQNSSLWRSKLYDNVTNPARAQEYHHHQPQPSNRRQSVVDRHGNIAIADLLSRGSSANSSMNPMIGSCNTSSHQARNYSPSPSCNYGSDANLSGMVTPESPARTVITMPDEFSGPRSRSIQSSDYYVDVPGNSANSSPTNIFVRSICSISSISAPPIPPPPPSSVTSNTSGDPYPEETRQRPLLNPAPTRHRSIPSTSTQIAEVHHGRRAVVSAADQTFNSTLHSIPSVVTESFEWDSYYPGLSKLEEPVPQQPMSSTMHYPSPTNRPQPNHTRQLPIRPLLSKEQYWV